MTIACDRYPRLTPATNFFVRLGFCAGIGASAITDVTSSSFGSSGLGRSSGRFVIAATLPSSVENQQFALRHQAWFVPRTRAPYRSMSVGGVGRKNFANSLAILLCWRATSAAESPDPAPTADRPEANQRGRRDTSQRCLQSA